jgi:uncharacterized protein (DUF924 family)
MSSRLAAVEVLNFWYGYSRRELKTVVKPNKAQMALWFGSREEDDVTIRINFAAHLAETSAMYDDEDMFETRPKLPFEETLADIITLDQFTRVIHRKTGRAFENDGKALRLAKHCMALEDADMSPLERMFVELPLMHSEDVADHERLLSMRGIEIPRDVDSALTSTDFAVKHWAVVKKFNRYPYRNKALGRQSTEDEGVFLSAGTSSYGQ